MLLTSNRQLMQAEEFTKRLTRTEREVVELARYGLGPHAIAERLICSVHTIRRHMENIRKKGTTFYGQKLNFHQLILALNPYLFFYAEGLLGPRRANDAQELHQNHVQQGAFATSACVTLGREGGA
ncbi:MAG: hypothetical protein EI684_17535 [Candidatus Viridilinea halotolerans]|uniref:HTH luxR-type domain-containing protein n=1 Tax=Candidatus Viridilinea halotolerans TaxID=2491704 RepID=A0A426TTY7_9CHLR|nr:MAG: hypothetical protein EI684_17535 [Candidatus Viridilinea halotolerans]